MSTKTAMPNEKNLVPTTEVRRSSQQHSPLFNRCMASWGMAYCGMAVLAVCFFTGCSEADPFPLEKITGKVTYSDGSLIKAGMIQIICKSVDVEAVKGKAPRGAKGKIDPETGEFSNFTTWKASDGVICGRNKVAIIPMEYGKNIDPMGRPAKGLLARKYFKTSTTDLEIEVVSGGENHFELTVEKPSK